MKVRRLLLALLLLVLVDRLGKYAAIFAIDAYRAHVSPRLRSVVTCRFRPTCSLYGRESIRRWGLIAGGAKTGWRIVRCGPWTPMGTFDPP
ncbi:MAG TPA: membrane protein insertion efficiency factor YidD [Thermoanaerobaculia bacterium]|nr:membrane protein insertion efficiency factor YidD [Thermoanaerobaculia bacterium]